MSRNNKLDQSDELKSELLQQKMEFSRQKVEFWKQNNYNYRMCIKIYSFTVCWELIQSAWTYFYDYIDRS